MQCGNCPDLFLCLRKSISCKGVLGSFPLQIAAYLHLGFGQFRFLLDLTHQTLGDLAKTDAEVVYLIAQQFLGILERCLLLCHRGVDDEKDQESGDEAGVSTEPEDVFLLDLRNPLEKRTDSGPQ